MEKEMEKEKNNYNILKFEGEYSKGKRNGKGKEYNSEEFFFLRLHKGKIF